MHTLSSSRPRITTLAVLACLPAVAALSVLAADPAAAAEPSPIQSCWTNIDTGETGCFDAAIDPVDAIEDATGRPIVAEESEPFNAARGALATDYLLVTAYDAVGKVGVSNSYFTSNAGICTGSFAYGFTNFGAWNDRFESFQAYNGCEATFFDDASYGGIEYGPYISSTSMGTFNNKASSLYVD